MAEDKRITKTKKNLKRTLLTLLETQSFEQITVTALCAASDTSRITFYTHYGDKYQLVDEAIDDLLTGAREDFLRLEAQNNPKNDPIPGYLNLADSLVCLYLTKISVLTHGNSEHSPYLHSTFFEHVLKSVEQYAVRTGDVLVPKISLIKITRFICYGLWGMMNACREENTPLEQVRGEVRSILQGILQNEVFTENRNR